jgi:hypothetical protein
MTNIAIENGHRNSGFTHEKSLVHVADTSNGSSCWITTHDWMQDQAPEHCEQMSVNGASNPPDLGVQTAASKRSMKTKTNRSKGESQKKC